MDTMTAVRVVDLTLRVTVLEEDVAPLEADIRNLLRVSDIAVAPPEPRAVLLSKGTPREIPVWMRGKLLGTEGPLCSVG